MVQYNVLFKNFSVESEISSTKIIQPAVRSTSWGFQGKTPVYHTTNTRCQLNKLLHSITGNSWT